MGTPGSDTGYQTQQNQGPVSSTGASGQWKQMLSGSVLYYSKTESYDGMFVQSTQYVHLCPNGTAYTYQSSAGGGDIGSVGISNPEEMEFTGSVNWWVTEQGGAAYFQIALAGAYSDAELWNFLDIGSRNRSLHIVALLALLDPEIVIALLRLGCDFTVTHLPAFNMLSISVGDPIIALQPGHPETRQTVLLLFRTAVQHQAEEYQHKHSGHYYFLE
jgi:hypothetical protein